ncbi:hypothetical protein TBR22_A29780 [Luteitalea sp. TBR-22]|nr:hypothetical protein [Luteitalea sp. TBR-22]BCS33751.1 hypothetical protein TBR22_A29780 [Luteitalea sp. TBR-22]
MAAPQGLAMRSRVPRSVITPGSLQTSVGWFTLTTDDEFRDLRAK